MSKYEIIDRYWLKEDKIDAHAARLFYSVKDTNKIRKSLELIDDNITYPELLNGFSKLNYQVYFDDNSNPFQFYRDTTFAFVLHKENKGLGLLGFSFKNDSILIEQIQGKSGEFLMPGWDEKLLHLAIRYSFAYDFESIMIKRAQDLSYYEKPISVPKNGILQHKLLLHKRYDFLAVKNGFSFNEEKGTYELKIK